MSMVDMVLGQLAGQDLGGLASKVGLTPEQVQMALHALGRAQPQPGDTATTAAAQTGMPVDAKHQILAQLGGEGGLGQIVGALGGGAGAGAGTAGGPAVAGGGLGGMLGGLAGMLGGGRDGQR